MRLLRCFTLKNNQALTGISCTDFDSLIPDEDPNATEYGYPINFPVCGTDVFQSNLLSELAPLSVNFIQLRKKSKSDAIADCGILLSVRTGEWVPAGVEADKSILLDITGKNALLYCPCGGTFLRNTSKSSNLSAVIDDRCTLIITTLPESALNRLLLNHLKTLAARPDEPCPPRLAVPKQATCSKQWLKRTRYNSPVYNLPDKVEP